jgi:hypothetical protein
MLHELFNRLSYIIEDFSAKFNSVSKIIQICFRRRRRGKVA